MLTAAMRPLAISTSVSSVGTVAEAAVIAAVPSTRKPSRSDPKRPSTATVRSPVWTFNEVSCVPTQSSIRQPAGSRRVTHQISLV